MRREDDQELWDLLGKTAQPGLSPFFARNVARQIRQEKTWRDFVTGWFDPHRMIPASAVALAVLVVALSGRLSTSDSSDNPPEMIASIDPQDYDAVADLDDLLSTDDDGVWNDNDSSSL